MIKTFVNGHKVARRYRDSPIGFSGSVRFRCVVVRYSKISRANLFLWGHELANSFLLFRITQMFFCK